MPKAMNVSNAHALKALDALEPLEAEALLFGHGEPWRDGVGEGVRRARAEAA
jgi:hypothetical protein